MGPRILAFVVAIAMVAGALAVRGWMDRTEEERSLVLRLTCVSELRQVCEELGDDPDSNIELTVEDAGTTADRLTALGAGEDAGIDGWLAIGNWPELVDSERAAKNLDALFSSGSSVASSRLALVVWKKRLPSFEACQRTWACLGDVAAAGEGGRQVKVSLPNPETSGVGLSSLGAAASSTFGNADFGRVDIEENTDFQRRLHGLSTASTSVETSLDIVLAQGPSAADAVVTLESTLRSAEDIPRLQETDVIYPAPVTTGHAFLGTASGDAGRRLSEIVPDLSGRSLRSRGWTVPAAPDAEMLEGGILAALRQSWRNR